MKVIFRLDNSTVEKCLMSDKKSLEMKCGCHFEYLDRKSKNTDIWYFKTAFNDLRSHDSIVRTFKRAFKENNIKCLEVY